MKILAALGLLPALMGVFGAAMAEIVYRSVDADGRVTFSSRPPADAAASEPVDLAPPLSEERQQQALERQQKLLGLVDQQARAAEQRRASRELALKETRQAEVRARAQLKESKVIRREDWVGGYGSGTLRPEYYERIRTAKQTLEEAERKSRRTGSGQLQ